MKNYVIANKNLLLNKLDPELLPDLAGQALSEIAPRGLQRGVGAGAAAYGAFVDPMILAGLPLQSPRLIGETALKAGQAQRVLGGLPITQTLRGVRPIVSAQEPEQKLTSKELENLKKDKKNKLNHKEQLETELEILEERQLLKTEIFNK